MKDKSVLLPYFYLVAEVAFLRLDNSLEVRGVGCRCHSQTILQMGVCQAAPILCFDDVHVGETLLADVCCPKHS